MWAFLIAAAGIAAAKGVNPATVPGLVTADVAQRLGLERLQRLTAALLDPDVWKRALTVLLGLWLVWLGFLVWVASNKDVQALAAGVVTKNPGAVAAVAQGAAQ